MANLYEARVEDTWQESCEASESQEALWIPEEYADGSPNLQERAESRRAIREKAHFTQKDQTAGKEPLQVISLPLTGR